MLRTSHTITASPLAPRNIAPLAAALLYVKPAPERALEVGTGTGAGALLVAREFPQASVRGVDISEEMIRAAQSKVGLDPSGRVAFRVADAAELPYDDESFDLIAHLKGERGPCTKDATHYGWELSQNPKQRELELLKEYAERHRSYPRCNEET